MSTIPFDKLETDFLRKKHTARTRLFIEISQFLIDFAKTIENDPELFTGLNSCDAVCMACVLDESIINEVKHVYACVEPFGAVASGHMISDWYGHFKRAANVEIITDIDRNKFEELFRLCVEDTSI